jgi:two-component system chemotaxis response regulator CheB
MPIKTLVVDDSPVIRQVLSQMIEEDPDIMVIGTARNGEEALEKIACLKPDIVTLDIEMPKMDGLECLAKIMERMPLPVIMVSHLTIEGAESTLKALELGAVDFITKSSLDPLVLDKIQQELIQKIKIAAVVKKSQLGTPVLKPGAVILPAFYNLKIDLELLAIGSSTGGPRALNQLLPQFPKNFPLGIVVAQHMPKEFTFVFAKRLNEICNLEVTEAKTGDAVKPGRILIAPSGFQTKLVCKNNSLKVEVFEQLNLIFKPSVDLLFKSIALTCEGRALSVLLTGMGNDGAAGMQELRKLGARTIVESEESCVIFGMPKAAIDLGGAEYVEVLPDIYQRIVRIITSEPVDKRTGKRR